MTKWEELQLADKLTQILRDVPDAADEHPLGNPYLTAYQIAIEFERRYPEDAQAINPNVGGRGTGTHTSLAQYLALELSRHLKKGDIAGIEGGFLSNQHLCDISFNHGDEVLHSSLTGTGFTLSMFRIKA